MGLSKRQNAVNDLTRKPGCPVPLPGGCLKGLPLPENFEDGVKMKCSNSSCKHQEQLIHLECFHALEENLIKIMSNIGSARGWTETQRRSNLWDKKGLTLIQKKCRCPCGLGLMSLDQNAMFLARKNSTLITGAHVKTKKGKNKNLPKLNFSSGSTIGSSGGKHLSRRENKRKSNFRFESNNSSRSVASTLTCDYYEQRRFARNVYHTKQELELMRKNDFEFPMLVDDVEHPLTSFGITSKKPDNTMSYAAVATSSRPIDEVTSLNKNKVQCVTSTPLSSRSMERKVEKTDPCNFAVESSSNSMFNEQVYENRYSYEISTPESENGDKDEYRVPFNFLYDNERKYASSESGHYADSGLEVDVSLIVPSPPLSSPCERYYDQSHHVIRICNSSESFAQQCRQYDLFSGPSFMLGELLVADISLPGAF